MKSDISDILNNIGEMFKQEIAGESRNCLEVDIGKQAEKLGYSDMQKNMIDGRTFINCAEFESGIAVPEYVAREAGLRYRTHLPDDSLILNFA